MALRAHDCRCLAAVSRRSPLPMLPAIAFVLLPKCPMCAAAWLGILGSIGAGSWVSLSWLNGSWVRGTWVGAGRISAGWIGSNWINAVWGMPIALSLLSVATVPLALRAWRTRNPRALLLGLLGAALLLYGKHHANPPLLLFAGLGLLTLSYLWPAERPRIASPRPLI